MMTIIYGEGKEEALMVLGLHEGVADVGMRLGVEEIEGEDAVASCVGPGG